MSVTINGTTGVVTPGINNSEGYTGDGLSIAAGAPAGAVALDASGNLGVGVPPTGIRLTIKSNGNGYTNGAIGLVDQVAGTSYITRAAGYLFFSNDGSTDHMTLDSSGNLGVGKAPAATDRLLVSSNGTKETLRARTDDSVYLYSLGTGTVTCSSGVLGFSSDERLKIDDGTYAGGLDAVKNIIPRYFYWRDSDGNRDESRPRELGFFAQNIQDTCGTEVVAEPHREDVLLGIHDRGVMAVLVSAIQEQQAIINSLTARVAALEASQNV